MTGQYTSCPDDETASRALLLSDSTSSTEPTIYVVVSNRPNANANAKADEKVQTHQKNSGTMCLGLTCRRGSSEEPSLRGAYGIEIIYNQSKAFLEAQKVTQVSHTLQDCQQDLGGLGDRKSRTKMVTTGLFASARVSPKHETEGRERLALHLEHDHIESQVWQRWNLIWNARLKDFFLFWTKPKVYPVRELGVF